jgi:methionyl-tRNA formyltransferase
MKIIILTSSKFGTAANHLPLLIESQTCEVSMVILSKGIVQNKKKYWLSKLKKAYKIGILGALNGIRMRKWFNEDLYKYVQVNNLEEICKTLRIPYYEVDTINSKQTQNLFKQAKADLGISLGNSYIGKKIFSIPQKGMINIHHEILPEYQNAQSIIWQIYNGSRNTGFTIHKIDTHIDTGEILYQENVPIVFKKSLADTIANTSAVLLASSAKGLIKVLQDFDHLFKEAKAQGKGHKYTTPSLSQYLKIHSNYRKMRQDRG